MFGKKKLTKQQVKKGAVRGGIFTVVAAATLVGAYALTPARKKTISNDEIKEEYQTTYFNRFVTKVTSALEDEKEYFGLNANINDLEITWPTKDGLSMNDIKVNGDLNIIMRNIDDFDFTVDLSANYNGKSLDVALGYVNSDIYLALQDLRIKSSHNSTLDFLEYVNTQFFDPSNPDGLGIDLNLESFIDETLGGIDLSSLLSGMSLPTTTEVEKGSDVIVSLAMDDINIDITLDKENLFIKKVDLGEIKVGDVSIKGALNCKTIDKVIAFDDPTYPKQRGEFVEVISYIGWVDRLLDLFKTRKFGFDFAAQISLDDEETGESELMDLEASINLDASDCIDFTNLVLGKDEENVTRPDESDFIDRVVSTNILNPDGKLQFGAHISIKGQNNEEYTNIDISYFDNAGYLTFNADENNDAVIKAKIDLSTLSTLIEKIPELLSSLTASSSPEAKKAIRANSTEVEKSTDDLLSFITSAPLIAGIKNGDYSGILDVLKDVSNDDSAIKMTLNLAPLGLGNSSEVGLKLDADNGIENALALEIKDVEIASINLSAQGNTDTFSDETINVIKADKDNYDDMSFATGVVDQVSDLLNIQRGKLTLQGTLFDVNNEGIAINGVAQFDAADKVGYGSVNIRQYSSELVNSNKYLDHNIDFDINDNGSTGKERNMHFAYNQDLRAKITTTTITDIVGLVTDLLNSDDERFTKFNGLIEEMLLGSAIGEIISSKDYLSFAKSTFLKSIKQINDGNTIELTINGEILGLESDICAYLNFRTVEGKQKIDSLELRNFSILGKTLNIKIGLEDYDDNYVSPINFDLDYMDFSQIKVLLDFGINTTKLGYYHLKANANLNISGLNLLSFDLDFHITVDGKKTRVYGYIPKVPWVTDFMSADIATTKINSEFVFEPTEDIGGVFHIVRNEDHLIGKDEVNYYQADSDVFLDNIISYLAVDMLNVKSSAISNLSDMTISTEKTFDPDYSKIFTDTGFQYSHDNSTGLNTWNVGINMSQLLCNNTLGNLELTLNGKDTLNSGLFTTAHVEMSLVSMVQISMDLTLENPDFTVETWPSDIEAKYNKVLGWYNDLSDSNKAKFDTNCKNKPLQTWKSVEQSRYF